MNQALTHIRCSKNEMKDYMLMRKVAYMIVYCMIINVLDLKLILFRENWIGE